MPDLFIRSLEKDKITNNLNCGLFITCIFRTK